MKALNFIDSYGLFVGVILGAGIFGLPYAVAQAGILWGCFHFVLAFLVMMLLHFMYAEITYAIKQRHRLPGYARLCLGEYYARFATFSLMFGIFGGLLIYGVLAGIFLEKLMGISSWYLTITFFIVTAPILLFDLKKIGGINFFLTVPLVFFIILLAGSAFSNVEPTSFKLFDNAKWFLPYGIFLFAFGGNAAIPEMSEIFHKKHIKEFRRTIFTGMLIPAALYIIFIISVVGVSGSATTEDALSGLSSILGNSIVVLGALIGFFAVLTSYLALGLDLRGMFHYDYNFGKIRAWLLVISVPIMLFLFGIDNFIQTLGIVGTVGIGINGSIILLLARHIRKKHKNTIAFLPIGGLIPVLFIVFWTGLVWQLLSAFGVV
ncbi:aromatic amino acid transport family protein [Patescibacteria group bacterium]